MHQEIKGDRYPRHGCQTNQLSVAKESGGTVVIGVQEGKGFLLQNQENSVDQFDIFSEVIELTHWSATAFSGHQQTESTNVV